ncbi:hypothetical protein PM082_010803 [Marasmius tenuissimus]|nr:hypothetical protein PM082_010803 [Marasmius tenuissimus]
MLMCLGIGRGRQLRLHKLLISVYNTRIYSTSSANRPTRGVVVSKVSSFPISTFDGQKLLGIVNKYGPIQHIVPGSASLKVDFFETETARQFVGLLEILPNFRTQYNDKVPLLKTPTICNIWHGRSRTLKFVRTTKRKKWTTEEVSAHLKTFGPILPFKVVDRKNGNRFKVTFYSFEDALKAEKGFDSETFGGMFRSLFRSVKKARGPRHCLTQNFLLSSKNEQSYFLAFN